MSEQLRSSLESFKRRIQRQSWRAPRLRLRSGCSHGCCTSRKTSIVAPGIITSSCSFANASVPSRTLHSLPSCVTLRHSTRSLKLAGHLLPPRRTVPSAFSNVSLSFAFCVPLCTKLPMLPSHSGSSCRTLSSYHLPQFVYRLSPVYTASSNTFSACAPNAPTHSPS